MSIELAVFMDIEVRSGCVSIESGFFMDVEVRSGCSADPSARRVGLQVFQRHPGVAKGVFWPVFGTTTLPTGTSVASSRGEGRILTGLRHGDLAHRCFRGILAWRNGLVSDLRHSDPTHRYLRDILACRNGLVSDLWHSNPAHRCLSGILAEPL